MSRLSAKSITRRLREIPLTGRPMSCRAIERATGIDQSTIDRITQRALGKLRRFKQPLQALRPCPSSY